jgi:hypothetical protein
MHITDGKVLVLAGCFSNEKEDEAWVIIGGNASPSCTSTYASNAQEADMRVWSHAIQSQYKNILVYSPDTDVYNIGTILITADRQFAVQINLPQNQSQFIDLTRLNHCYLHDPDLASLPATHIPNILLQLYIVSGCDYISYFCGIGKTTFLKKTLRQLLVN